MGQNEVEQDTKLNKIKYQIYVKLNFYTAVLKQNPAFLLVHCRGSIFKDHTSN